jgi:flagellar hook-associated protein 2
MAVTLGLGSTSATSYLNQDVIDKLKAEDEKISVTPLEEKLTEWDDKSAAFEAIKTQFTELESLLSTFSQTSDANVFDSVSYSNTGDSVIYDVTGTLSAGSYNISVTTLATKEAHQSNLITEANLDNDISSTADDKLTITHSGVDYNFDLNGVSYNELVENINDNAENPFTASLEEVEDGQYRLIIKSKDTGTENNLTISETNSGTSLGLDANAGKVVGTGTNLVANVDGIDYNVSSNTVKLSDDLSFTAIKTGDSSINIQEDPNAIIDAVSSFVDQYNALNDAITNATTYSADDEEAGVLQGSSELRAMLDNITSKLFDSYGPDGDATNIFNIGIELNEYGELELDSATLSKAIADDKDAVFNLFVGSAENKGLGQVLYEYTDELDGFNGLITLFGDSLDDEKTKLEEDKTEAVEKLDYKYEQMSLQFASYTTLITQMEASFSSLKLTIDQSVAQK